MAEIFITGPVLYGHDTLQDVLASQAYFDIEAWQRGEKEPEDSEDVVGQGTELQPTGEGYNRLATKGGDSRNGI